MDNSWYSIDRVQPHLVAIRERLDKVDSRFLTEYVNLFLILGSHSAILFDTGSGSRPIKRIVEELIGDRELYVIISHHHFDHLGNNYEFDKVHVHAMDLKNTANRMDVSFLKDTPTPENLGFLQSNEFTIEPCKEIIPLIGDEEFDLGDITIKIMYTPGHTPGSICLITDKGDVFTGDTFHLGSYYLPPYERYQTLKDSLDDLISKIPKNASIYPSHETYPVTPDDLQQFENLMITTNFAEDNKEFHEFLDSYVLHADKISFVFPKEGYIDTVDWY